MVSGNASVFVPVFCSHFLRFRLHFDYFLDPFWGLWGIKKTHALSRARRGGPQEHFGSILASFWSTLTPFCLHFGSIVAKIVPKVSIKYIFAYFFPDLYGRQKASCPDTHIHAYTRIYTLIRTYIRMHARIYTYIYPHKTTRKD